MSIDVCLHMWKIQKKDMNVYICVYSSICISKVGMPRSLKALHALVSEIQVITLVLDS